MIRPDWSGKHPCLPAGQAMTMLAAPFGGGRRRSFAAAVASGGCWLFGGGGTGSGTGRRVVAGNWRWGIETAAFRGKNTFTNLTNTSTKFGG